VWGQSWTPGSSGSTYYSAGFVGVSLTPTVTSPLYPLHVSTDYFGGPSLTYHSSSMFGLDVPENVELAFGWQPSGQYGYWIQSRGSGYPFPISLNPLGGNVGIGTMTPQYTLSVRGNVGAQDVVVTNAISADYVFSPTYRLRPLSEVNAYIQANHHLPDVPSEAEVKEKGLSLNEMQAKLLAKVEELTLHAIQADERNSRLEQQNRELQERLAQLEKKTAAPAEK
jgi:hypothetical protein